MKGENASPANAETQPPSYLTGEFDSTKTQEPQDEYVAPSSKETEQIEDRKKMIEQQNEQSIPNVKETENETQNTAKLQEEKVKNFYTELGLSKDEPRFIEAVEIYDSMDQQSFPDTINTKPEEAVSESAKETWQLVKQLQSFAKNAKDNPRGKSILRDDRLALGDEYNKLIASVKRANNRPTWEEYSDTLTKGFCHELASIVQEYKEKQELWQIEGERSLNDALDAYADTYGIEAAKDDLGKEIPGQIDKYTILPLVTKINDAVRQDWQRRITPIESYKEGAEYSLICSRVFEPFPAQESRRSIFSCSLLTNSHHETHNNGSFGFIFPPDHIIAANSHDIGTINDSNDDVASASFGIPVVMSYDRVLRESQKNKTFSEITTRDLPIGIFYIKDKLDENNTRKNLIELARMNPELPIIAL